MDMFVEQFIIRDGADFLQDSIPYFDSIKGYEFYLAFCFTKERELIGSGLTRSIRVSCRSLVE